MSNKKNILITGSSSGIGSAIAAKLAKKNNVYITGRNLEKLEYVSKQINAKGYLVEDLCSPNAAEQLIIEARNSLGSIDVLVNNAGQYFWGSVDKTPEEEIEKIFKLNLEVPYKLCSLTTKAMKDKNWGRIINIGSISGVVGENNASLYSASKSGLIGMSKAMALELAENNITVNIINPGWVKTELAKHCFKNSKEEQDCIDMIPQRRFIHPDEVASMVNYLISDDAKGITGQSINLCAGLSVG